jgi:hypothetical protein
MSLLWFERRKRERERAERKVKRTVSFFSASLSLSLSSLCPLIAAMGQSGSRGRSAAAEDAAQLLGAATTAEVSIPSPSLPLPLFLSEIDDNDSPDINGRFCFTFFLRLSCCSRKKDVENWAPLVIS